MSKKLLNEGLIQKAIDWWVGSKIKPMEQNPNSEWSQMRGLATKIKSNQIAVNKYMEANKDLISSFSQKLDNPKYLRAITNSDEADLNYKKRNFLLNQSNTTGDKRYEIEALKYDFSDPKYLDYELNPKYEGYMNKFFQTKDKRYFEEALKYNPTRQ